MLSEQRKPCHICNKQPRISRSSDEGDAGSFYYWFECYDKEHTVSTSAWTYRGDAAIAWDKWQVERKEKG